MQSLRDRVLGKVQPDTVTTARDPMLSMDEEAIIVEHLQTVAFGYGYTPHWYMYMSICWYLRELPVLH